MTQKTKKTKKLQETRCFYVYRIRIKATISEYHQHVVSRERKEIQFDCFSKFKSRT